VNSYNILKNGEFKDTFHENEILAKTIALIRDSKPYRKFMEAKKLRDKRKRI